MKQLNEQEAIEFHDSNAWKSMSHQELAEFQVNQPLLCVPFEKFHEAVEATLERPVYTHEFADAEALQNEIKQKLNK